MSAFSHCNAFEFGNGFVHNDIKCLIYMQTNTSAYTWLRVALGGILPHTSTALHQAVLTEPQNSKNNSAFEASKPISATWSNPVA